MNTFELIGNIPYSITLGPENHILVGFSNGNVRAFHTETFEVQHLPGHPHYLHHDIATASDHQQFYQEGIDAAKENARFPDVKALLFHHKSKTLTILYSDRSIYQWSVTEKFGQSLLIGHRNHVGAILDLEMVPRQLPWLPAGVFITSGVDATIRFWSLEKSNEHADSILTTNILSPELRKVLYLSPDEKILCDNADSKFIFPGINSPKIRIHVFEESLHLVNFLFSWFLPTWCLNSNVSIYSPYFRSFRDDIL